MHRVDTFDRTSLVLKNKMNNNLQEKIMHNLEQGSSVYVCFVTPAMHLTRCGRPGLMFKLYERDINDNLWSLINKCHRNTLSSIVVNQTHQGGFRYN